MARPTKGVSALAFRIIKRATKIRLDRGETLSDIVDSYNKLSQVQADELTETYKNYTPGE